MLFTESFLFELEQAPAALTTTTRILAVQTAQESTWKLILKKMQLEMISYIKIESETASFYIVT